MDENEAQRSVELERMRELSPDERAFLRKVNQACMEPICSVCLLRLSICACTRGRA